MQGRALLKRCDRCTCLDQGTSSRIGQAGVGQSLSPLKLSHGEAGDVVVRSRERQGLIAMIGRAQHVQLLLKCADGGDIEVRWWCYLGEGARG